MCLFERIALSKDKAGVFQTKGCLLGNVTLMMVTPPTYDVPTLKVTTLDGYNPALLDIENFINK